MQNESAESAEISKHWIFVFWNLKATLKYVKWFVLNVWGARDHTFMAFTWKVNGGVLKFATYLRNLSSLNNFCECVGSQNWSFFVDVINVWPQCNKVKAVFISSCITWLNWFIFWQILHLTKSVLTLRIGKSTFCLLMIQSILKFLPLQRIRSAERIRGISRNF